MRNHEKKLGTKKIGLKAICCVMNLEKWDLMWKIRVMDRK